MEDFNSIIYGHRRKDNTMFSPLLNFKEQEHVNENPFVYIVTKQGVFQYAIFSTHYDNVKGDSWKIGQKTDESKQGYIDYCLEKSLVSAMVTPRAEDKILTLSTCSGMGDDSIRFLVHGVLINN
jgi:sortase B